MPSMRMMLFVLLVLTLVIIGRKLISKLQRMAAEYDPLEETKAAAEWVRHYAMLVRESSDPDSAIIRDEAACKLCNAYDDFHQHYFQVRQQIWRMRDIDRERADALHAELCLLHKEVGELRFPQAVC